MDITELVKEIRQRLDMLELGMVTEPALVEVYVDDVINAARMLRKVEVGENNEQ